MDIFSHLFVVRIVMFLWKDENKRKRVGPIFLKKNKVNNIRLMKDFWALNSFAANLISTLWKVTSGNGANVAGANTFSYPDCAFFEHLLDLRSENTLYKSSPGSLFKIYPEKSKFFSLLPWRLTDENIKEARFVSFILAKRLHSNCTYNKDVLWYRGRYWLT